MPRPKLRFRVRTLLMVVALVAVFLGGSRMALTTYRAKSYRQDVQFWADWRDRYQQAAARFRSSGDTARAAKRDRLAAYCEEWRRIMEHAASTGEPVMVSSGPSLPN